MDPFDKNCSDFLMRDRHQISKELSYQNDNVLMQDEDGDDLENDSFSDQTNSGLNTLGNNQSNPQNNKRYWN